MRFSVGFSGINEDFLNLLPKGSRASVVNSILAEAISSDILQKVLVKELGAKDAKKVLNKISIEIYSISPPLSTATKTNTQTESKKQKNIQKTFQEEEQIPGFDL